MFLWVSPLNMDDILNFISCTIKKLELVSSFKISYWSSMFRIHWLANSVRECWSWLLTWVGLPSLQRKTSWSMPRQSFRKEMEQQSPWMMTKVISGSRIGSPFKVPQWAIEMTLLQPGIVDIISTTNGMKEEQFYNNSQFFRYAAF